MNKEEIQKILDELYTVRPEMLNDKAKRLFEAIMRIADERDKAYKIIDKMAEFLMTKDFDEDICVNNIINPQLCNEQLSNCKECIKEYFKKEVEKE